MGRISDEDIMRVREATDLVALISETVPLRQKGRLFWGLCPFHGEKTPSFKVDPATQLWHCFGCGLGGDAFGYVMRTENLEFPDAVRRLAERAHVEIHEQEGGLPAGERERLMAACEAATAFFHGQLTKSSESGAQAARDYLKARGFGLEVAKHWRLGYAPAGGSPLSAHLTGEGFKRDELIAANLAVVDGRSGSLKDRFFDRVMFPISDLSGRMIAFGGRVVGDGVPKYLNSSDTPIFHKSSNLYGISVARNEIVKAGLAVVVEGYTDVIALHEAGLRNAVATLGTALGSRHVKLLTRFANKVVYLFDGDEAGLRAADRAAEFLDSSATPEAGSRRVELDVAVLPEGKDPADAVAEGGADAVRRVIEEAVPLLRFVLDRRLDAHDLTTPEGRAQALAAAARVLAGVRGSILAQDYASHVAGRLMTDYETVMQAVRTARPEHGTMRGAKSRPLAGNGEESASLEATGGRVRRTLGDAQSKAEAELLRSITLVPALREQVRDLLAIDDVLTDPANVRLANALTAAGGATGMKLFETVAAAEPELAGALSEWLVDPPDDETVVAMFRETVERIKEFRLRRQILRAQGRMQSTDPIKDPEGYDDMFREVAALRQQLEDLRRERADSAT